jgi:hypothetical protein
MASAALDRDNSEMIPLRKLTLNSLYTRYGGLTRRYLRKGGVQNAQNPAIDACFIGCN